MKHYYAFCSNHGRIGPNRIDPEVAAQDGEKHMNQPGPHFSIIVKESSHTVYNGIKKFSYRQRKIFGGRLSEIDLHPTF